MIINAIVAMSRNGYIGKDNQLLWYFKKDLKYFKSLTEGHTVIMGRKTFESIGKPLPNRLNVVLTKDKSFHFPGVITVSSLPAAFRIVKANNDTNPFIIGGKQIYELADKYIHNFYVTIIDKDYEGDTYFSLPNHYKNCGSEVQEENGVKLIFKTYERLDERKDS
jgi:dihydrofolate reductase